MKSDVITVRSDGNGASEALSQTEAVAAFRSLPQKSALHLRLLTEEMMGMLQEITGEKELKFWIEDQDRVFQLHLVATTVISRNKREELLSVSTSGTNAAAKGVMGKLRDIFERALDAEELGGMPDYYARGLVMPSGMAGEDPMAYALNADMINWSMQQFRSNLNEDRQANAEAEQEWDELEKSIVANLADEVSISIRGNQVEMVIYKKY